MDREQEGEIRSSVSPRIKLSDSSMKNAQRYLREADSEYVLRETVQCREDPEPETYLCFLTVCLWGLQLP